MDWIGQLRATRAVVPCVSSMLGESFPRILARMTLAPHKTKAADLLTDLYDEIQHCVYKICSNYISSSSILLCIRIKCDVVL